MGITDGQDIGAHNPWWRKLGWLILIWCCSVAALGVVCLRDSFADDGSGLTR